ncbi:MAG: mandelate racemase/muconate lactonizing enzyme family protein [Clostridiales bacterium]|jgi:L-alanine-DL-glutamate epimerase-like enolase superfamily enzyme|nr:mandelate racemase/muconate lactonizing enzyme family protein [Clostridiales bacterium]
MAEEMNINRNSGPSQLKITDMRFVNLKDAPMHCILVKIYTNQGITGIGEIRDFGSCYYAAMLKGRLLGENPCNVEKIFKRLKQHGGPARQGGGVSGIEIALWDLAGKAYGVPVYQMLGGRYRDSIRVYCDLGVNPPPGRRDGRFIANVLKGHIEKFGFTMVKAVMGVEGVQHLHPDQTVISAPAGQLSEMSESGEFYYHLIRGDNPEFRNDPSTFPQRNRVYDNAAMEMPYVFYRITERGLDLFEQEIAAMRDVLGYGIPLAIDHIGRLNLEDCGRLLRRLEKYNLAWVEDALPPYYIQEYKELSRLSGVPLATGEDLFSLENFEPLCRERAVPIIHPDICSAGGILEMKRIGDMAQRYHAAMIAHMCETPVAALATAHMGVATENFVACEFNAPDVPWWDDIVTGFGGPIIKNGFITPNEKPGLGIDDINDEALAEHLMPGMGGVWDETSFWDTNYSTDKKFS